MSFLKRAVGLLNGFRKYSIEIIILAIATSFRVKGLLTGQEFVNLIVPISVAFMAMNGLEHASKTAMKWIDGKYGDSK